VLCGSNPFVATLAANILESLTSDLRLAALRDLPAILDADRRTGAFRLAETYVDLGVVTVGEGLDVPFTVPEAVLPVPPSTATGERGTPARAPAPSSSHRLGPAGPVAAALYGRTGSDTIVAQLRRTPYYRYAKLAERVLLADISTSTGRQVREPSYIPYSDLRFVCGLEDRRLSPVHYCLMRQYGDLLLAYRSDTPPLHAPVLARSGRFWLDSLDPQTGLPREVLEGPGDPLSPDPTGWDGPDCARLVGVGRPGFCRLIFTGDFIGQRNVLANTSPLSLPLATRYGRLILVREPHGPLLARPRARAEVPVTQSPG
jgi:hypothetical protein